MSKVKIQGHASGTGVLTVTAPNTSTDRTITLPDETATLSTFDPDGAVVINDTGADVDFRVESDDNANMLFVDGGNDKVGIGTSSPARLLTLYGDTGIALQNSTTGTGTSNGTHIWVNSEGSGELLIQNREDSDIEFYTDDTEVMRIDSSGNVGVGVTPESWDSQFTVLNVGVGGVLAGGTDGDYFASGANWYQTGGADKYVTSSKLASLYTQNNGTHTFQVAPSGTADAAISWTTAMQISNDGFIFMGASGNTYNIASGKGIKIDGNAGMVNIARENECPLFVNRTGNDGTTIDIRNSGTQVGRITVSGSSTAYNTTSDYRLKENVVPMTGSIDRLKELKPSKFNFIADAETTVDGFLAHEVSDTVPEAISGTKDAMTTEEYEVEPAIEATYDEEGNELTPAVEAVMGEREVEDYQGIDQSKLVPLLTSALQEAVAKIEELTTRIETLEAN